jgi:hypothetical protein
LRPAVTLPVELYSDQRIREFDDAEAELGEAMRSVRNSPAKSPRRQPPQ